MTRRRRSRSAAYRAESDRLSLPEGIARLVIKHRMARRLTQQDLAELVGTSHSAISRIESGRHLPSVDTLKRVAEALGFRLVVGFEAKRRDGVAVRDFVSW